MWNLILAQKLDFVLTEHGPWSFPRGMCSLFEVQPKTYIYKLFELSAKSRNKYIDIGAEHIYIYWTSPGSELCARTP